MGLLATQLQNRCTLCRMYAIDDGFLCQACDADFDFSAKQFTLHSTQNPLSVYFATFYDTITQAAISAFKDHENIQTLPFLFHVLYRLSEHLNLPDDTVILPVPTTQDRLLERGFFPVGILAQYLSSLTGFALYDGVSRPFDGVRQRGLSKVERLDNVNNAFVLEYLPQSNHVLLFDDVSTTGATFKAIAALFEQSDIRLFAACVAHGHAQ